MLDTVLTALRGRDFPAAARAARDLILAEPDQAEAHHLLSLALRESGDLVAAQAAIDRAIELAPEHAPYHLSHAMLATLRRDPATARSALGEAVKQDPNQLLAYISLTQLALIAGDAEQAEQHLRYAERINPEHPHVLTMLGQLQLARGDGQAGLNSLSLAAQRAPQDAMVQGALGWALMAQKHYAFAEQALRNALAEQPQVRSLRLALLQSLIAQQQHVEAEQELDAMLAQAPDDVQALELKGRLAATRGAYDEAVALLQRALQQRPRHAPTLEVLVRVWIAAGQAAQAQAFVEELVQRDPQFDAAWAARVEFLRREPKREAETILQWLQACPESLSANEQAAQILEAAGDLLGAATCATRVVVRAPMRVAAQLVLARAELRENTIESALVRLETLRQRRPEPASWRSIAAWLGRARDASGDPGGAVEAWLLAQSLVAPDMILPALASPDAAFEARLAAARAAATASGPAPRLLCGAPGSGAEQLAVLLRSGANVLSDRFGPRARDDGFRVDPAAGAAADVDALQFAQRWRDALAAAGADAAAIDWLPYWDARVLPAVLGALPGTRMLVALRDPRDMLLNWLAFGTPQRLPLHEPVRAARWLASALEQFLVLAQHAPGMMQPIRVDRLGSDGDTGLHALAAFAALPQPLPDDLPARLRIGTGGLPNTFAPGEWQRYATVLREPFALLEPVAQRLDAL